ncbi:MAG: methyl-accepting chemotaxis protein [Bacillota bacterium]|nr:methyl-accepting chemotaxis protein [Bacillota bacterium]
MNQLEVVMKQNKIFMILSWLSSLLSLISCLGNKLPVNQTLSIVIPLVLLNLLITLFYFRKIFIVGTVYMATIGTILINLVGFMVAPSMISFFVAIYFIVMVAFYEKWTMTLLTGISNIIGTNVMFFTFHSVAFSHFDVQNLIPIDIFMVLIMIFLIVQCGFSRNLRKGLSKSNEEALSSQQKIESMLEGVKKVVTSLGSLNTKFNQDVKITEVISNEITEAFSQISSSIDSQSQNIVDATQLIQLNEDSVKHLLHVSTNLKASTDLTVNVNREGMLEVDVLRNDMDEVNDIVSDTAILFDTLNKETENIGKVLELINAITEQTNLLSLNAAI